MRTFIDIVTHLCESRTDEGDLIAFPGNPNPTNNMAVVRGGADVVGFPQQVHLNAFARAYVTAALWSSSDDSDESGGQPLDDNYSVKDIATPTLERMAAECAKFQKQCAKLLARAYQTPGYDVEHAGHDFWLTRNGHGAGFWDRGLGLVGKRLTDVAHQYGEVDLVVGDDGMIHGS
jgi:hypothetical protein